jgi:MFS family permease
MEPLKREFGFSDMQMGMLSGTVFGVAYALGAVPFAILADRWRRQKIVALSVAFWSFFTAVTAAAGSYAMLVVTRALVGLGEAGAGPAMLAMLANRFAVQERSRMTAALTVVTSLSGFAAFWLGGIVIERFGWRPAFLVFGLPGLVLAVLIFKTVSDATPACASRRARDFTVRDLSDALFRAPMLNLLAVAAWNSIITTSLLSWTPTYLIRSHGMPLSSTGFWIGLYAVMSGFVGAILGGCMADAYTRREPRGAMRVMLLALSLNLPLSIGVYAVHSRPTALALLLLSGIAFGISGPPLAAQFLTWMPDKSRATLMSIVSMCVLFVGGFGATLAGALSDTLAARGFANGLQVALVATAALGVMPILHLVFLSFRAKRDAVVAAST